MKNKTYTILLVFLAFICFQAKGQNFASFERQDSIGDPTFIGTDLNHNENNTGTSAHPWAIVDNPVMDGLNRSKKVLQITVDTGANGFRGGGTNHYDWYGIYDSLQVPVKVDSATGRYLHYHVLSDTTFTVGIECYQIHIAGVDSAVKFQPGYLNYTTPNKWQDLILDLFSPGLSGNGTLGRTMKQFDYVYFVPNRGPWIPKGAQFHNVYIDNVRFSSDTTHEMAGVLFDYEYKDTVPRCSFGGNGATTADPFEVVANPAPDATNRSAHVMKMGFDAGSDPVSWDPSGQHKYSWYGFYDTLAIPLPIDTVNGQYLHFMVMSDSSYNVGVELNGGGKKAQPGYPKYTNTGKWEDLTVDLAYNSVSAQQALGLQVGSLAGASVTSSGVKQVTTAYLAPHRQSDSHPTDEVFIFIDNIRVDSNRGNLPPLGITNEPSVVEKVFPNPVSTTLYITSPTAINTVKLFNVTGQLVRFQTANRNSTTINVAGLPKGLYLLKLNETSIHKILVQ